MRLLQTAATLQAPSRFPPPHWTPPLLLLLRVRWYFAKHIELVIVIVALGFGQENDAISAWNFDALTYEYGNCPNLCPAIRRFPSFSLV